MRAARLSPRFKIPAILLEGDEPYVPPPVTPPAPPQVHPAVSPPVAVVPETVPAPAPVSPAAPSLHLFAQDTYWLHAYWELADADQQRFKASSSSGRLVLRIFKNLPQGEPVQELDLDPAATDWFVKVQEAGVTYVADLGCYNRAGEWLCAAVSNATSTPAASVAAEGEVRFATIPLEKPLAPAMTGPAEVAAAPQVPGSLAAPTPLSAPVISGQPEPAAAGAPSRADWTPEQTQIMAEILRAHEQTRSPAGSAEIAELVRLGIAGKRAGKFAPSQPAEQVVSLAAAQGPVGISSLAGLPAEAPPPKTFWFNVNAELVIYGGTKPDATVTLGGQPIRLRPDGTFSCRFALPDGIFALPAEAVAAGGGERRLAEMSFSRLTRYEGEVGAHPQEPGLQPPRVEAQE